MPQSIPCRSCRAPMYWATTEAGKAIPLDAPTPDGNLAVRNVDGALHARALVLDEEPLVGEHRATSHFATCEFADQHRKPRR
jgi:hypothetical protein